MIRPLFIIGNKRSGTSQLVRMLNLHPAISVAHEADIIWILYCFHRGQPFTAHPWDGDRGMRHTLEAVGHLLDATVAPAVNYQRLLTALMEKGSPWLPPRPAAGVVWLGDKKPMQHTDPQLLAFIRQEFPAAHFLHIVRHPLEVAASSDRFNRTADGDFWLGLSTEAKVARWTYHEELVWQLRAVPGVPLHSLRYEDFCRDTAGEMTKIADFLGLTTPPEVLQEATRQTLTVAKDYQLVPHSAATRIMAERYGYELRPPAAKWRRKLLAWWRNRNRLKN